MGLPSLGKVRVPGETGLCVRGAVRCVAAISLAAW